MGLSMLNWFKKLKDRMANSHTALIGEIVTNDSFRKGAPRRTRDSATVKNVDFLAQENAKNHHTGMYHLVKSQLQTPIFRRGQAFSLQINFKSAFKLTGENLRVDFAFGPDPKPGKNTLIHLKVAETGSTSDNWDVRVKSQASNSLQLEVTPSPKAPVGIWMVTVVTQPGKDAYEVPQHLYIVFNPWCKDDQVYMENEDQLNEYILSETGMVFVGDHKEILHRSWSYNQFFSVALPTAIYLLENSPVPHGNRGNPIDVSRALTRMMVFLLEGNWDTTGRYEGGVSPLQWQTSNAILEKFMTQKSIVKYGQCWVYAAVTCALCRAIGIPCRVVTCFKSAHDTERNLTLDTYYSEYGRKVKNDPNGKEMDSVWNFHVWNDVWMTRPDLEEGYGGWQAIDSTPQERDEKSGQYESGPASLVAIKKGEVGYIHNTMFIFSEVNADAITWQRDYFGAFQKVKVEEDLCGKYVITKAVGLNEGEDITTLYKYPEGSREEREAMFRAAKVSGNEERFSQSQPETLSADDDVYMDILPVQSVTVGKTLQVSVQIENRSPKARVVNVSLGAHSVMYTGVKVNDINISGDQKNEDKKYKQAVELAPGQKEVVSLAISPSMYLDLITEMGYVKISGNATVKDTKQVWFGDDTVMAMPPIMNVETPEKMEKGKVCKIKLSFTNTMQQELTECSFSVASNCMFTAAECKFRDVKPNEDVTHELDITPDFRGECVIMGLFNAKNLAGIAGSKAAKVV